MPTNINSLKKRNYFYWMKISTTSYLIACKKGKEDLQIICSFLFALEGDQTDEDLEDIDPEDPEVNEDSDLLLKFSRMRLKVKIINYQMV